MLRILHLSDLHLAPVEDDEITGDYKSDLVPLEERQRRVGALEQTLHEFGQTYPEELDAVVISGDVTVIGHEDGYKMLGEVLAKLGSALPSDPGRVVVVPGNHDVTWGTKPSSEEHYALFLEHVRRHASYRTPHLEGIDITPRAGGSKGTGTDPVLIGPDNSFLLLALNSSNYCGVIEPTNLDDAEWETALAALDPARQEAGAKDLRKLRIMDVARLTQAQLNAARRELVRARAELSSAGVDPDQVPTIAVLHHHLLPVSTREELKPYESISNLGEVRAFLRDNRIQLVLHGHKHASAAYWDHIPRAGVPLDEQPYRVAVIAGATIGAGAGPGDVFRLIELDVPPAWARASVASYGEVAGGGELPAPTMAEAALLPRAPVTTDGSRIGPISGPTISDVYSRAIAEFERLKGPPLVANLVCEITTSPDEGAVPRGYPPIPTVADDDRGAWIKEIVDWWQQPRTLLGPNLTFTHGGRILQYDRTIDQLDQAAAALKAERDTSRGIVTLLDPRDDQVPNIKHKFPAFCLAQFVIRQRADDGDQLDCTAYFRKQEFRFWWPVNVAELAHLQRQLCERLEDTYDDIVPGSIVTVSAIAKAGKAVPRVAVPRVDRMAEENQGRLWLLALAATVPDLAGREPLMDEWRQLLDDLKPEAKYDSDGVPVATEGLATLIGALEQFGAADDAAALRSQLQQLRANNDKFVEKLDNPNTKDPRRAHRDWVRDVQPILHDLRATIDRLA